MHEKSEQETERERENVLKWKWTYAKTQALRTQQNGRGDYSYANA